jgi:hypothetical protein
VVADRFDGLASAGRGNLTGRNNHCHYVPRGHADLTHIIAGSTTMFYLVATHSISLGAYFMHSFWPTLFGNSIGGVSMVAALGHAQVVGGKS